MGEDEGEGEGEGEGKGVLGFRVRDDPLEILVVEIRQFSFNP